MRTYVSTDEVIVPKEGWEQIQSTLRALQQVLSHLDVKKIQGKKVALLPEVRLNAALQWLEDAQTFEARAPE